MSYFPTVFVLGLFLLLFYFWLTLGWVCSFQGVQMFCILFGIFSELFLQANAQLIISTTSFYSFLPKNCVLIFFFFCQLWNLFGTYFYCEHFFFIFSYLSILNNFHLLLEWHCYCLFLNTFFSLNAQSSLGSFSVCSINFCLMFSANLLIYLLAIFSSLHQCFSLALAKKPSN